MRRPIDQTGARQIAEHRTVAADFRALEIGSLVNIDHTTRFSRITFRQFQLEGLVKPAKRQFDPLAFLAKVGTGKTILKYRKGRIIYAQGEEADQIFYIQSGKIKVTVVSEQGKEAVVGLLEAGQFFGEGCLNGQASRIGTARAMEECLITSITRKAMLTMLRQEPRFSELFVTYLVTRSNRIEEDLIDQLFNSSEKRLARLLLLLANFAKDGKPIPIDASINQATLAEMIGTTRSRVSYFLNKFRKLGLISYNGNIEVHRSLLNAVLYERPQLERADEPPQ
jgi:CRP/FNR family cyclic AMP-dependent transcriptional regulator